MGGGADQTGQDLIAIAPKEASVQLLVPVYNEGENVRVLYGGLIGEGVRFDSLSFIYDFEEDTSLSFVEEIAAGDDRVQAEKNRLGRGVLNALRWGFSHASAGPVIILMGDNSDKLSIIPNMIHLWESGATIVCPSRYMKGGRQYGGGIKSVISRAAGLSLRLLGFPTADATNNFKLYDGDWLRGQAIESKGGFEVALELCCKAFEQHKVIRELPTVWKDRTSGESRFRLWAWMPHYLKWYIRILRALALRRFGK